MLGHTTFATTDDLEVGGVTDPRRIAASLWPLDELGRALPGLRRPVPARARPARAAPPGQAAASPRPSSCPAASRSASRYQECFDDDPLLPPELLPRPWPGREARELVLTCRRLGVLLREEHDKPKLFAPWDDLLLSFRS